MLSMNERMEIVEKKTVAVSIGLKDLINKLNFIDDELHELNSSDIHILKIAWTILNRLEDNLYFNNEERKERF